MAVATPHPPLLLSGQQSPEVFPAFLTQMLGVVMSWEEGRKLFCIQNQFPVTHPYTTFTLSYA